MTQSLYCWVGGESGLQDCSAPAQSRAWMLSDKVRWAKRHGRTGTWLGTFYFSPGQSHQRRSVFLDQPVRASHHTVSLCHFLFLSHIQRSVISVLSSISSSCFNSLIPFHVTLTRQIRVLQHSQSVHSAFNQFTGSCTLDSHSISHYMQLSVETVRDLGEELLGWCFTIEIRRIMY